MCTTYTNNAYKKMGKKKQNEFVVAWKYPMNYMLDVVSVRTVSEHFMRSDKIKSIFFSTFEQGWKKINWIFFKGKQIYFQFYILF